MKKILAASFLFIAYYPLTAQDQPDLEKLRPKRFIDKVEIIVGPSITFPNGRDRAAGNNPRISTGYFAKGGYSAGVGIIHSIQNFELRFRFLWEQRGYVQKLWDDEPNSFFESANETKTNFFTFSITPTLSFGREKKFQALMGLSYSSLSSAESIQTLSINGQVQSIFRTGYSAGQAGIQGSLFDASLGIGYLIYSKDKKQISIFIQNDSDLSDAVNENGTVIKNNSLRLIVQLKLSR